MAVSHILTFPFSDETVSSLPSNSLTFAVSGSSNILMWYTDASLHSKILDYDQKSQAVMRADTTEDAFIAYTNTSRTDPIEHRYRDAAALSKLKELKRRWDPDGCFTKELLW